MMYKRNLICVRVAVIIAMAIFASSPGLSQQAKQVNHQYQSWLSINSTSRITKHWGVIADAHMRRNHFFANHSFEFLRAGIEYKVDDRLSFVFGYGHMWLHPSTVGWSTVSNENRIYQQVQFLTSFRHVNITQRLRNEQRWQQKIVADKFTGHYRFTDRVRYLLSISIPVFKNPKFPALNIADELLLQTGKDVVTNPFDQNRFFVGIREKLSHELSFDTGYMIVYQQKNSGYQYDLNNTFRLFFYYSPSLVKKHKAGKHSV